MSKVRVRCPACGMQVSQDRFNQDYLPLQLAYMQGLGRGRGFKWYKNVAGKGHWVLLLALRTKLRRLLAKVDMMVSGYERTEPFALVTSALLSSRHLPVSSTSRLSQTNAVVRQEASSLSTFTAPRGRE